MTDSSPRPNHRLTVDHYHRMIQAGVFTEQDNLELLEGWLVAKLPCTSAHDAMISIIGDDLFMARLPRGWHWRGRSGFTMTDSEPEPDITAIRGAPIDYLKRHPTPADAALVVEVADSNTLEQDRTIKIRIYARDSVPVYWIVNLVEHQVEVYTDPTGPDPAPTYRTRRIYRPGDLVPFVVDGRELGPIPAQELLP